MMIDNVSDSLNLKIDLNLKLLQDNGSTATQIRDLIRYFTGLGAYIHPLSRLHRYATLFESLNDTSHLALDYALLESLQFLAIAYALQLSERPECWLSALNAAASGHADHQADPPHARARSVQFELFTMACLAVSGFKVVQREPDLHARIGDTEVAFAAKRLRSEAKLDRNLRDAARQLAHHELPGFIALDLSFINSIEMPVYVPRLEQLQAIAAIIGDDFAQRHQRKVFDAASRPNVLGVLMHTSIVGRSVKPVSRFVSRRWLLCVTKDSPVSRQLMAAFQTTGSTPWTRTELSNPPTKPR